MTNQCKCGHNRDDHTESGGPCLMYSGDWECPCNEFGPKERADVDKSIEWAREYYSAPHPMLRIADEVERLRGIVESQSAIIEKQSAKPEAPKWLDKPDGDGWWWCSSDGDQLIVVLVKQYTSYANRQHKWLRIAVPTPPVVLPKERTVTLTAKVHNPHRWRAEISCNIPYQANVNGIVVDTKEKAIQWVRDTYGIEPEIEGEPIE